MQQDQEELSFINLFVSTLFLSLLKIYNIYIYTYIPIVVLMTAVT
jgi:hypothetical protein